jgi:hypothetical protein
MNGRTIEELAQEHPEIKDVLSRLGLIEKKAEPSLMDDIHEAERVALEDISVCIKRCETTTGRSLYNQAKMLLETEFRPTEVSNFRVGQIIEVHPVRPGKTNAFEKLDMCGSMKPTLRALGRRAGQNKTQWASSKAFLTWAQRVLDEAFHETRGSFSGTSTGRFK